MAATCAIGFCAAPASSAQAQDAAQTVRGVVLNSLNHEPIARALGEAGGYAALSDNTGHFELQLPAGSSATIAVRKPGYTSGPSSTRITRADAGTGELTFLLTPQAVIAGHISEANGEDADSTRVMLFRQRTRRGQHWWETQGQAETDSAGHFRLSNLQTPAEYLLMTVPATDREGRIQPNSSTSGYPAVFYPDGGENSDASLLTLAPGQQANVEMSLARQPFYPVTIQVRNDVGSTPLFVQIHDESGLQSDFPSQWNAQKRIAQADLPNGHYFAELRSYNRPELYGRVEFTVAGGPVSGISVVVLPLRPVLVNIRKDFTATQDGTAAPTLRAGVPGNPDQADPGLNISLIPVEGASGQVGSLSSVPGSASPLLFQMEGVNPGRYWVHTTAFEGYVASITSGGVDLAREALIVGPGNTTPPIEVTLRNDGAQIHCTIQRPAQAGSGAGDDVFVSIFAVPAFQTTGQTLQASAVGANETSIQNVAPGTYSVIALDQFLDIDGMEPAVLNSYLGKGQTVTVEAQGSASATLDVIHASDSGTEGEANQ